MASSLLNVASAPIKLMAEPEKAAASPYMRQFVNYRKSGLSLNHIIGCPLNCGYCVRHFWGNFEMKRPQMLCTDDEAVTSLLGSRYFVPHVTPIQLFNKATDPFLPAVKPHTHYVLQQLDERGLTNHVLVITRARVTQRDIEQLDKLKNIRLTLFFTYSGITDPRIEPIGPSGMTLRSIRTAAKHRKHTRLILYWRPLVPGWNDDEATMRRVMLEAGQLVDAIVFTGYYHREENAKYFDELGVSVPYNDTEFQRRKVLPAELDERIVRAHRDSGIATPLFRKTSCGATYAHGVADYNGHWGVRELCDICPAEQQQRCAAAHHPPSPEELEKGFGALGVEPIYEIEEDHVWTTGLGEEGRYFLQHGLGFQTWDIDWPHFRGRHGRAPIGHSTPKEELDHYTGIRERFHSEALYEDE